MKLNLNISHDLKAEELHKIVALSKETNKPVSQLILEAARDLATPPQPVRDQFKPQELDQHVPSTCAPHL
jgi:hypothetical protein